MMSRLINYTDMFLILWGAKKERSNRFVLFLSKPQAWYIIDARSAAYIISSFGAVSHHALA